MKKYLFPCLGLLFFVISCKKEEQVVVPVDQTPAPYQEVVISSDWFDVQYVDPKTYIFREPQSYEGNSSYLILGDDKAIMFDTGAGENQPIGGYKIRNYIDSITDLPITLFLSHFHYDHCQNVSEFDWLAFADLPFLQQNMGPDNTYTFSSFELIYGNYPPSVHVDEWLPLETDIDLGNRIVQLVHVPGHTRESVALIDKTNKLAFLGDFLYNGPLYMFDTNDFPDFMASVDHLISLLDSDYRLFGAHDLPEIDYAKLNTLKDFLQCIDDGTCYAISTTVEGFMALVYTYQNMEIVVFLE